MKKLLFIFFITVSVNMQAQNHKPMSISVSYFGETITHPGVKAAITYNLYSWNKSKTKKDQILKVINKVLCLGPTLGFFYHRRFQTSLFALPEISYLKKNEKGNFLGAGIGLGYMRTFIPSTYEETSNGEFRKTVAGYNYLLSNYFVIIGRSLNIHGNTSLNFFFKPQLMAAVSGNKSRAG